jgi:hypothetical protein
MAERPHWLTDEALDRSHARGSALADFLSRRRAALDVDPAAVVDLGPALEATLAQLRDALSGREPS